MDFKPFVSPAASKVNLGDELLVLRFLVLFIVILPNVDRNVTKDCITPIHQPTRCYFCNFRMQLIFVSHLHHAQDEATRTEVAVLQNMCNVHLISSMI